MHDRRLPTAVEEVEKTMRNLTLTTTLSALLVALPLSGALAQNDRGAAYRTIPLGVDTSTTASIGAVEARYSRAQELETSLKAAEATARGKGGAAAIVRPDIQALRMAVSAEARDNGGELSEASYRALYDEVQILHHRIDSLPTR